MTLLYALFSQGVYQHDEHYQILEYAHMKLFGQPSPDHLAWEYTSMMRPGLLPLVASAVGQGLLWMGLYSPFVLVFLLQLLSGAISIGVFVFFFRTVEAKFNPLERKWMLVLGFFLWFLAYLHVHFNPEMLSGNLLLLLAALTMRYRTRLGANEFGWGLLLGLVAGMLFAVRYQAGFALAGYGLYLLVFNRRWRLYLGMVPGVLVALAVGFLADHWLYGEWTIVPWNYLRENILNAHMDKFGLSPWWYYLTASVLDGAILFGLLALAATLCFFYRHPRHVIAWMLVPFLLVHFFLGHKELRFFFPVLFFMPYFIVLLVRELPQRVVAGRVWRFVVGAMVVMNLGAMSYCLLQNTPNLSFYKMMRRYCADNPGVVTLTLEETDNYYSFLQNITTPRTVEARFYMPEGFDFRYCKTHEQLEQTARALTDSGARVLILSEDPALTCEGALLLDKIKWSPYPDWIIRYFNFNNWTRFCILSKNVYQVSIAAEEPLR